MCLAVPMKVVSKNGDAGVAEMSGVKRQINFLMLPEAEIGDYVIVHAGFAIQKLNEDEANKRLQIFRDMAGLEGTLN